MILKPGKEGLQEKRIPLDALFNKIIMIRDRLRVLEQKINTNPKLGTDDKVQLQQYVTGCYGSLTTFNVLFADGRSVRRAEGRRLACPAEGRLQRRSLRMDGRCAARLGSLRASLAAPRGGAWADRRRPPVSASFPRAPPVIFSYESLDERRWRRGDAREADGARLRDDRTAFPRRRRSIFSSRWRSTTPTASTTPSSPSRRPTTASSSRSTRRRCRSRSRCRRRYRGRRRARARSATSEPSRCSSFSIAPAASSGARTARREERRASRGIRGL